MENLTQTNTAIALDLSLIPLVHDYLSGASVDSCALKYNLDISSVNDFLSRSEVKRYISNQLRTEGYASRQKRLKILSNIVDDKLESAKENDIPVSNKDIIEVLKLLREEDNDLAKLAGDLDEQGGKQAYIQIINQLKMD